MASNFVRLDRNYMAQPGYDRGRMIDEAMQKAKELDEKLGGLGSKWKSIVATDEKILKKTGERRLMFRELPERHESVYETSDPLIINYIRERMAEPGMAHISEEAKPLMMKLPDGTEIPVAPLTREGQQAVNAQLGG